MQSLVSNMLGGGALGDTVGAQVGAAVVGLIQSGAQRWSVDVGRHAIAGGLFGSQDVVDAWAEAAGTLVRLRSWVIFRRCCRGHFRTESQYGDQGAIDSTVTDAIEDLFGDHNLWDALQTAVVVG